MSANGKASAERFREVVLPHLADALAFARWLTGNPHDAEDVVQEACLRAFAGIDGYAGGNARAWLLAIVRNTSSTWLVKNRSSRTVLVGDQAELDALGASEAAFEGTGNGPEADLIAKADAAELEAAIAGLPHALREILVLHDINGLSYREISVMLSVPLGTVMSRLSRARGVLMGQLGGKR